MSEKQIYHPRYRDLITCLKGTRKKLGLSQAAVAVQLGLCRTWVAKVEACELGLDLLHLVKLCRVYGLKARDMIGMLGE